MSNRKLKKNHETEILNHFILEASQQDFTLW